MVMMVQLQLIQKFIFKLLKLRNLGGVRKYEHDIIGFNSRLDTIQAAILNNKLKSLNKNNYKDFKSLNLHKISTINILKKLIIQKVAFIINM